MTIFPGFYFSFFTNAWLPKFTQIYFWVIPSLRHVIVVLHFKLPNSVLPFTVTNKLVSFLDAVLSKVIIKQYSGVPWLLPLPS